MDRAFLLMDNVDNPFDKCSHKHKEDFMRRRVSFIKIFALKNLQIYHQKNLFSFFSQI